MNIKHGFRSMTGDVAKKVVLSLLGENFLSLALSRGYKGNIQTETLFKRINSVKQVTEEVFLEVAYEKMKEEEEIQKLKEEEEELKRKEAEALEKKKECCRKRWPKCIVISYDVEKASASRNKASASRNKASVFGLPVVEEEMLWCYEFNVNNKGTLLFLGDDFESGIRRFVKSVTVK